MNAQYGIILGIRAISTNCSLQVQNINAEHSLFQGFGFPLS